MTRRLSYGDRAACRLCDLDIEWHGKPRRRVLVPASDTRAAVTIVDGGWIDRGGNRFCDTGGGARWDANGYLIPMPHVLHKPYAEEGK